MPRAVKACNRCGLLRPGGGVDKKGCKLEKWGYYIGNRTVGVQLCCRAYRLEGSLGANNAVPIEGFWNWGIGVRFQMVWIVRIVSGRGRILSPFYHHFYKFLYS